MDQALVIDEILRHIFRFCSASPSSLLHAAITCQAWKEPALDHLWASLDSISPVLHLNSLASQTKVPMQSYLSRVRTFSGSKLQAISSGGLDAPDSPLFPNLLDLSLGRCSTLPPLACLTSPRLRSINLNLGFKGGNPRSPTVDLDRIHALCPLLETLIARGTVGSPRLAAMAHLATVSLRIGAALKAETVTDILTLNTVTTLELHADHLSANDVPVDLTDAPSSFPHLKSLILRADGPFVELLLWSLATQNLGLLHIDLTSHSPQSFEPIFEIIERKARNSLTDLTIEHHIDIDEAETISITSDTPTLDTEPGPIPHNSLKPLTFLSFTPLSHLHCLSRLIFNTTLAPDLTDEDILSVSRWWPRLVHLDLGTSCSALAGWKPRMTLASLPLISKGLMLLETLIIPLRLGELKEMESLTVQSALKRLTVSSPDPPPIALAGHTLQLFPNLVSIDGTCNDSCWDSVQGELDRLHLGASLV